MMDTFKMRLEWLLADKGLNANSFSTILGYEKPEKIYRLLRDEKNMPSIEIIQDISRSFEGLNTDWLVNGRGEPYKRSKEDTGLSGEVMPGRLLDQEMGGAENHELGLTPAGKENASTNYGARTPAIITTNEQGIDNILYVPIKAQAGYLHGYGDAEFIDTLPTFRMPGLSNRSYRMFEVEGPSMSPTISDRDRVIAEWVPSFDDIRENRVHVVVHRHGVAVKRVLNRIKERNKVYLKSDTITYRQDYPLVEIDPADIIELWYVRMKVSSDLREPSELYNRVSDLEIKQHEIMKLLGKKG